MSGLVYPTFLIIGAARSGTTLLSKRLSDHPDLWFTEPKETHFLALAGRQVQFTGPGDAETINTVAITDADRWHALLDGGADFKARGEGSVSTMYYPGTAIRNIRRYCANARMIVLLRDPVQRAHSAFLYQVSRGYEDKTFGEALDLEEERIANGWHHIWHYAAMGRYALQLEPFLKEFDRQRLLILGYEDLVANPAAGLRRCFEHVGVEPLPMEDLGAQVNAGGEPRSALLQKAMTGLRSVETLRRAVKRTVPFAARERIRSANLTHPPMTASERERLEERYAPDRRRLSELLGPDAPTWT